jgi:hypothetical protein
MCVVGTPPEYAGRLIQQYWTGYRDPGQFARRVESSREQGEDLGLEAPALVAGEHRRRYEPPLNLRTLAPEAVCCNFEKINRSGGESGMDSRGGGVEGKGEGGSEGKYI